MILRHLSSPTVGYMTATEGYFVSLYQNNDKLNLPNEISVWKFSQIWKLKLQKEMVKQNSVPSKKHFLENLKQPNSQTENLTKPWKP
jgi:hypothetical protein